MRTISSFWASFTLLYFNDYNCFPAVSNKNCCFQTECWAVTQSQGFTAIHILLGLLFKMPEESQDWFTTFTKWGTRVWCINHSGAFLCFPHYFSPHSFSSNRVVIHVFIFYHLFKPPCSLGTQACTSHCNHMNFPIMGPSFTINVF